MTIREVQEWLTFHGLPLVLDGVKGPATNAAIKLFRERKGLDASALIDRALEDTLSLPISEATRPVDPHGATYSQVVIHTAERHLNQHPREVGDDNCGPWVRLYMHGRDGSAFPWCAGFATSMLDQAARDLSRQSPVTYTWSCNSLASDAKAKGLLFTDASKVAAGDLFLVPKGGGLYQHVGLVEDPQPDHFVSIEGNSNTNGSRNGFEVTRAFRVYKNLDFVRIR